MKEEMPPKIKTPAERKEFWQDKWDQRWNYNLRSKAVMLLPRFRALDNEGKIGDVVVDVGSGPAPMSGFMPEKDTRKIITVDIAEGASPLQVGDTTHVSYDLEDLGKRGFRTGMIALQLQDFLGIGDLRGASSEQVDTMLISEVLNYVDFRKTLGELAKYLKKNGRFIIFNRPHRGRTEEFSEKGAAEGNKQIVDFLSENGFEIEEVTYTGQESDSEHRFMLLIARKK